MPTPRSVALVTLGCARNEVDSEELAARLEDAGWRLVADAAEADVAVVNTCGFIEQAKKDSIDVLLEAADLRADAGSATRAVVAVGCLAERYGDQLAASLPEADAVLGFDSYPDLARHLDAVLHGRPPAPHVPRDRRTLLPVSPARRTAAAIAPPGHASTAFAPSSAGVEPGRAPWPDPGEWASGGRPPAAGPRVIRRRLDGSPWAPLKLASGCDRRCAFCAIPSFRGAFVSRPSADVLAEAAWLAQRGVRELLLVSENSTSYGKDLGDLRALESLLPRLAAVAGITRVRVSYLQPAEVRPGLVDALTGTPGVAPYFDLSFQHASPRVLRRMRRFGGTQPFLSLLEQIRARAPRAGIRSNVIVGFPGETAEDLAELEEFLQRARLDVVGVFGYSDEEGTEATGLDGKLAAEEIAERVARVAALVEEMSAQRAEDRVGEEVDVLVEEIDGELAGRAAHQGPDVDGVTRFDPGDEVAGAAGGRRRVASGGRAGRGPAVGDLVRARVVAAEGPDLVARLAGTPGAPA